ncbi:MAG TPA: serine/threonine-protein kinase [Polyangia bacterium]
MLLCPRCKHAYRATQRTCIRDGAELQPAAAVDSRIGTTFGNYRLIDVLGTGGMGAVYLAEHVYIGTRSAIKVLHEHIAADSSAVARLLQEARAAAAIGHGNIVTVSDFGETPDGSAYVVMEYVEGRPLDALLEEAAPLPLFRAINIVNQIGSGLGAAHEKGIVHRDLKPENVMLVECTGRRKVVRRGHGDAPATVEMETSYDHVKLLDFGVAKMLDADLSRQTMSGLVIGTPQYMAPENARGKGGIDHRIDIYALGVLFFEMLTGKLPFDATTPMEMMLAHCTRPVPSLHERNPEAEVTPAAEALIRRAMAKDPGERHADMHELLAELQECYGDENFLRNVEKKAARAAGAERAPRPRSLTEDLKELFAGGGNEILERAFAEEAPKKKST